MKCALFLLTDFNGDWQGFGSGVMVGDGLALTAKHVIQNAYRQHEKTQFPGDDILSRGTDQEFSTYTLTAKALKILAIQTHPNNPEVLMWDIETAWTDSFTDIAVLHLKPNIPNQKFPPIVSPFMTAELPPLGQHVAAFGYHSTDILHCMSREKFSDLLLRVHPTTTTGDVLAIAESEVYQFQ